MNDSHTEAPYAQDRFLDAIVARMGLRNDASLSRLLEVAPSRLSKVRHGKTPVNASLLIGLHEKSGLSIQELRALLGDRRSRFRVSAVSFLPEGKRTKQTDQEPMRRLA